MTFVFGAYLRLNVLFCSLQVYRHRAFVWSKQSARFSRRMRHQNQRGNKVDMANKKAPRTKTINKAQRTRARSGLPASETDPKQMLSHSEEPFNWNNFPAEVCSESEKNRSNDFIIDRDAKAFHYFRSSLRLIGRTKTITKFSACFVFLIFLSSATAAG